MEGKNIDGWDLWATKVTILDNKVDRLEKAIDKITQETGSAKTISTDAHERVSIIECHQQRIGTAFRLVSEGIISGSRILEGSVPDYHQSSNGDRYRYTDDLTNRHTNRMRNRRSQNRST